MRSPATQARATFTSMKEGTQEDWNIIGASFMEFQAGLADRVIAHLRLLEGDFGGFAVDRMTHSLQTATRAHRAGKSGEYVRDVSSRDPDRAGVVPAPTAPARLADANREGGRPATKARKGRS